jgi:hypothetical protein
VKALPRYDFAVLVVTADDLATSRGASRAVPRDNVVFEAGLFMGRLGPERTFVLYDAAAQPKLPSDLAGITLATFTPRANGTLREAIGEGTDDVRDQIKSLGPYLALESPSAGETVGRQVRARGRCSTSHTAVAVVIHPAATSQYYLRPGSLLSPGVWEADLTVGLVSGSSGKEYEVRAFLKPSPATASSNPLPWWPNAIAATPPIRITRA